MAQLVLVDEQLRVEIQRLGVRAQKALDVRRPGQQVPFLVLQRAQILRADLRRRLDLGDVDPRAHPRFTQRGSDVRHRDAGYSRTGSGSARSSSGSASSCSGGGGTPSRSRRLAMKRSTSPAPTITWRGLEPS